MSNSKIQHYEFVVKAGMTADDVRKSKEASAMQKKYASAFDTDGEKGFSQKEADLFNATIFSEKADGTVTFWTRQKDGTEKGTKFKANDNNIQFKFDDEVKPYVKKVPVNESTSKQNESVSFFNEAWSGHQIARLTGNNAITDWLQNKDKVCTDGKDDGKLSVGQYALSFVKGLIGGIPKAIINHPISSIVATGLGAAAVVATSGAILPVLGAVGLATGVGMIGYGTYKAVTAKTDGEAKQALESMGMGVTTTAMSMISAGKTLDQAAKAGVKSAQISEDANIFQKTIQMFKATPEALKLSKDNVSAFFSKNNGVQTLLFDRKTKTILNKSNGSVTADDIISLQKEGYNIFIDKNNRIFAKNVQGKTIDIGILGKTDLYSVRVNLNEAQANGLLIDLGKLDPKKSYVGFQYGVDNSAKCIQKATQHYCPNSEVPTHVMGIVNENGNWVIYQSNASPVPQLNSPAGVNKSSAIDWFGLAKNQVKKFEVYEMPLDRSGLQSRIGESYGIGDIINLLKARIFGSNGAQPDEPGLICSEYIAMNAPKIRDYFQLSNWCITPAHFKSYVLGMQLAPIT